MLTHSIDKKIYTYTFDVSIIVIMYDPDPDKLYQTLDSILIQRNIRYEIIICDDGSRNRLEQELLSYFSKKSFNLYSLVFNDTNHGTVSNYCSGLEKARGRYSKVISPGDYFTDENILSEWIRFMKNRRAEWSFSDTYYYSHEDRKQLFLKKRAHPQIILPYLKGKKKKCIWNSVALWDNAYGAAILGTTKIQLAYCRMLREKDVIYAEDLIYQLMMFDGRVGCYFPKPAVCYEYGTGISTSCDPVWSKRLRDDRNTTVLIMQEKEDLTDFQKDIIKALKRKKKIEKLFIRGKLCRWLKWHIFPRLTKIPKDMVK